MSTRAKWALAFACVIAVAVATIALGRSTPIGAALLPAAEPPPDPQISLQPVAKGRAGDPVYLRGTLSDLGSETTTVQLQRRLDGAWVTVASGAREEGAYAWVRVFDEPTSRVFRTIARQQGKTVDTSKPRAVKVADPAPEGTPLLPDLAPKKLTDCSASEQPCFKIVTVNGRRLLKFPVMTVNVGVGALEVRAFRSSRTSDDWIGTQRTYYTSGDRRSQSFTGAEIYWAGDGHDHWHIRDFDFYQLRDATGRRLRVSEKHGFCLEDNSSYRDWLARPREHPNVPPEPVYEHEESCGEGQLRTTRIVNGLSVGWGDTYPSSLPDQAIDVTTVPDGDYVVMIKVDGQDFIRESDEANNTSTVKITIKGDRVSAVKGTATGV
jgi:hypothetical protein